MATITKNRGGIIPYLLLSTFFPHGTLEKLPAQHKKRLIVLEQFAGTFEPGASLLRSRKPEPGENVERLLLALKLKWQETLQPFGDRGYNSLEGFQRELEQRKPKK